MSISSSLQTSLSKPTPVFGLSLWILIVTICISISAMLLLFLFVLCIIRMRRGRSHLSIAKHAFTKGHISQPGRCSLDKRLLSQYYEMARPEYSQVLLSDQWYSSRHDDRSSLLVMRGKGFTLADIQLATNGLSDRNVTGSGDYGVVYRGFMSNNVRIVVKKLWNDYCLKPNNYDSCRAQDFKESVRAIGQLRHKNLVKLIGYCVEGDHRMLVYEYAENKSLHYWLHEYGGNTTQLSWSKRMKIVMGTAKGLAYLHEDVEPKVLHQNIKSTNILLDYKWNPKISDVGFPELLQSEEHYQTTPTTYDYVASGHASIDITVQKGDVYSFGVLLMEIVSGKIPIDCHRSDAEVYLVEWLKHKVLHHQLNQILDPKLPQFPSSKDLKRILLIALRCVDPEIKNRPKMGDVIHMLEPLDLLLSDGPQIKREISRRACQGAEMNNTSPDSVHVTIHDSTVQNC